jgi:hypothetical protein
MNTDVPPPPPRHDAGAGPAPTERTGPSPRLTNPYALFAATVAVAGVFALAFGWFFGWAVANAEQNSCAPSDGWCGLGAALAGMFVGGLVGVVTYVAAGVLVIVRCRPRGARAHHILAHLAFPAAAIILLTAILNTLP